MTLMFLKCFIALAVSERTRQVEKRRAYLEKWRVQNRDKCRQAVRLNRHKFLEKRRAEDNERVRLNWQNPEWRAKIRERKRLAYQNNPEHRQTRKEANSRWNRSERGRHYYRVYEHKYRRFDKGGLLFEDWKSILESQDNCCAICKRAFSDDLPPQRDHILPFSMGGRLVKENVQALCKPCNARKGNKLVYEKKQ